MQLSKGQQEGCDRLVQWWRDNPVARPFRIDGYAGTGKTTIVQTFLRALNLSEKQVRLLGPTGKAARVLSDRTGWEASTIHRELYMPSESKEITDLRRQLKEETDPDEVARCRKQLAKFERRGNGLNFDMKESETSALLFVVDEISMIEEGIAKDLQAMNVPLILLGDPGQLPPVKGRVGFREVKPDVTLTEILRQDEGSTILEAARMVREGQSLPDTCDWGAFRRIRPRELSDEEYAAYDVILCGTHKVRKAFNRRMRRELIEDLDDLPPDELWLPRQGDRLICRANNYNRKIMNGQLGTSLAIAEEVDDMRVAVDFEDEDGMTRKGEVASSLRFKEHYDKRTAVHRIDRAIELDFAYALTTHSAQGSEWDEIVILNDWHGRQAKEWLYTAITRGAKKVTLVG